MTEPTLDRRYLVSLQGKDFALYAGVLDLAHQIGLESIHVELVQIPTEENGQTAIARATVRLKDGRECSDYGDANPRNCSPAIAKALIRMASTRAKGRALRDITNVGQTMLEELPDLDDAPRASGNGRERAAAAVASGEKPLVDKAAPSQERPAPSEGGAALGCVECGVVLTAGQAKVSQGRFRLNLCPKCQKEAAKAVEQKAEA